MAVPGLGAGNRADALLTLAPGGEVCGGVDVPVSGLGAHVAAVGAFGQGQFGFHCTTGRARLTRREPPIGRHAGATMSDALVAKLAGKLAPALVAGGLGQVVVAHQVRGGDGFHNDDTVGLGQLGGELVESAGARRAHPGVCPAQTQAGLGRFADPFRVRDRARCRCLMCVNASRRAREASRVSTSVRSEVATTAAATTPTSTPTVAPVGRLYSCGPVVKVRSKHTDAYHDLPASLLTVMLSILARPRTSRRRSLACARQGAARATHPYLGTHRRPGCRCSAPVTVNRSRSRWRALNLGNRDFPFKKLVCAVCGLDAIPERPDRLVFVPRRDHGLGGVPAADQVEV